MKTIVILMDSLNPPFPACLREHMGAYAEYRPSGGAQLCV